MSASEPIPEAFFLAFFYLHTSRRIFLYIEVFEVKARKLSIPSRAGSIIHAAVVQQEAFSLTMTKCFPSFMEPVILDCCIT